jgi:hypothetical protein
MEEEEEFNSEVYMAFFYYTNAFDSMEAKFVLEALKKDGEDKHIRIIQNVCNHNYAKMSSLNGSQIW